MRQLLALFMGTIVFLPEMAVAHPFHDHSLLMSAGGSFVAGSVHPWTGADHLLAMLGVALWSVQLENSYGKLLPVTFVAAMGLGIVMGALFGSAPMVEGGILLSLVVVGAFVLLERKLSALLGVTIVALFASMHGAAHGVELPLGAGLLTFTAGALVGSATVLLLGIAAGRRLLHVRVPLSIYSRTSLRVVGGAIALSPLLV